MAPPRLCPGTAIPRPGRKGWKAVEPGAQVVRQNLVFLPSLRARTYLNLMVVMGLGGLWRGAAISYLTWGLGRHDLLL